MTDRLFAAFSDAHGNHLALQHCVADAEEQADALGLPLYFWFLGDVANGLPGVGDCLLKLYEMGDYLREWLIGNHDLAQFQWWPDRHAAPLEVTPDNKSNVRQSVLAYIKSENEIDLLIYDLVTLDRLRTDEPDLWQHWTTRPAWAESRDIPGVFIVHGLIVEEDTYHPANTIVGLLDVHIEQQLNHMMNILRRSPGDAPRLVLAGHTHLATVWEYTCEQHWKSYVVGNSEGADYRLDGTWYELNAESTWVVNVGSVGWQKDGKLRLRAAETVIYALVRASEDGRLSIAFRSPTYDLQRAMTEYRQLGAPEWVIVRVSSGI
jgi:hypothetical protein